MKLDFDVVKECKICGFVSETTKALCTHIQFKHKEYNIQTYYDKFFKRPEEGKCVICGKETKFNTFLEGYKECCGKVCAHKTEHFKETYRKSISKKTDEEKKEWNEKAQKTKLKNSSYNTTISDEEVEKRKEQTKKHIEDYLTKANCTLVELIYSKKRRNYIGQVKFRCNCCKHETTYVRSLIDRYNRTNDFELCHICNNKKSVSVPEKELGNFILSIYSGEMKLNDRKLLEHNELDIVLPEKKLAFEMDGIYWHNENVISSDYHLNKTIACENEDYQLIHIFDDEWKNQQNIVKSRIKSLLGLNERIFARKCEFREVSYLDCKDFLETNHIQGNCMSKYRYGLYYNDELVSVMTFGQSRFKKEWELLRFCNKLNTNVIGGASKLFKDFIKIHPEIISIISFADRRWSIGNLYEKIGFKKMYETKPAYYYIMKQERKNRMEFQKHKLVSMGYDKNKTEHEIMKELGYKRIYDCGNIKYIWQEAEENC